MSSVSDNSKLNQLKSKLKEHRDKRYNLKPLEKDKKK